ncbi:MAG: hypothetical protein JSV66_14190 [Trueperaceae bacterium]|nr:MAG: hypothetical protein JSV66_14190 [Trueperaceae bacterium]
MTVFLFRLTAFKNSVIRAPILYSVGLVFLALVYWGILFLTRRGVRFLDQFPAIGTIADAVAQRSLEALFLLLMLGVAFSVLTTAITTLYSSEDLSFLLSLPASGLEVFSLKVVETYLSAAFLPALFTLPVLIGLGLEKGAPLIYYPIGIAAVLALYAIPVAIGSLLALILIRISPAGRVKEIATAVSVLFAAALIFGLRVLRPERLSALSPGEFELLLQRFARFEIGWSPPSWASEVVWSALAGRVPNAAVVLAGVSLILLLLVARLAALAYREGWIRSLDSRPFRFDSAVRRPAFWETPFYAFGRSGSIMVKDNRLLFRDPTQWSQLLVLVALAGVYLVSTSSFEVDIQRFKDAVGTMNLMFLGFLLAGVGVRTAYPIVSLEGEGFWMLRTGPIASSQIVAAKFLNALPVMLLLGGGLGLAAAELLDLSPTLALASPIAGFSAATVITAIGVGLGAAYPRFDATNPAEIPLSPGGLLYMTLSLVYAALMTIMLAYPAWQAIERPDYLFWMHREGMLLLLLLVVVTVLATALPLFFGSYRLARYEPGAS